MKATPFVLAAMNLCFAALSIAASVRNDLVGDLSFLLAPVFGAGFGLMAHMCVGEVIAAARRGER